MEYVKKPADSVCWQFWFLGCYTVDRTKKEEMRSSECSWHSRRRYLGKEWKRFMSLALLTQRGREDVVAEWAKSGVKGNSWIMTADTENKQTRLEGRGKQKIIHGNAVQMKSGGQPEGYIPEMCSECDLASGNGLASLASCKRHQLEKRNRNRKSEGENKLRRDGRVRSQVKCPVYPEQWQGWQGCSAIDDTWVTLVYDTYIKL